MQTSPATMPREVYSSSKSNEWETPQDLFDKLDAEFNFTLDAAANAGNAKCENYFTEEIDGLTQKWEGTVWCNPPYGRAIKNWVQKAYESAAEGATVVLLIPARTCTAYWHDYVMKGEIRFIRGRLRFSNSENPAPFPSAIVVFRPGNTQTLTCSQILR